MDVVCVADPAPESLPRLAQQQPEIHRVRPRREREFDLPVHFEPPDLLQKRHRLESAMVQEKKKIEKNENHE